MHNEALAALLRKRITEAGKITFAEFMELALYHPEHGYYNAALEHIGPDGDFITSPAAHPAFGVLIAGQINEMWQRLGAPSSFTVVEMAAGNGQLCQDILRALRLVSPRLYRALRYVLVERGSRQRQARKLAAFRSKRAEIHFVSDLSALPDGGIEGCFLSNELFDALPVHRVTKVDGKLKEVYVGLDDGGHFVDSVAEPSSPALERHLRWLEADLPEGNLAEISLLAPKWMREVGRYLRRGYALTIDYGYDSAELYAEHRREGTVLGYRRHGLSTNPYGFVGNQDLTAHVDFTALARAGEDEGLRSVGFITQREFLFRLGMPSYAEALRGLRMRAAELQANLKAMDQLVNQEQLGRLKVLAQQKGVDEGVLTGIGGKSDIWAQGWKKATDLPRLKLRRPRGYWPPR